jgi:hypothetical protein
MKINKSIKLISSIIIFLIIFSLTLSLSVGCQEKEVSTETGPATVDDPEADAAFYSFFIALGIVFLGEEIKEKKAKAKATQVSMEEELESVKAEYEAQYDFKEEFLNTIIAGPSGAEFMESNKKLNFLIRKIMEAGAETGTKDTENQHASVTTVPEQTTQTTEKEKPTGSITLLIDLEGAAGEMTINFDTETVTGSYNYEDEIGALAGSFSGSIDISTNTITASGSETYTGNITGDVTTDSMTLEGTLSSDLKSALGIITNIDGEFPWTATTQ